MRLQTLIAFLVGKISQTGLRALSQTGGTALPGLIALKIDPIFIPQLLKNIANRPIIITGTNGKTTTARILQTILSQAGFQSLSNRAGSNLERGIASSLINANVCFNPSLKNTVPIWEIDEAVFANIASTLNPQLIIITNLFRDQLDRYFEIDTTRTNWQKAINQLSSDTRLVLNGDDPNISSLASNLRPNTIRFGSNRALASSNFLPHASEAVQCPKCDQPYQPVQLFIAHYGRYKCLSCGYSNNSLSNLLSDVKTMNRSGQSNNIITQFSLSIQKRKLNFTTSLTGRYNLYNLAAAISAAASLRVDYQIIKKAVESFQPAFGRGEIITLNNRSFKLLLAKNPAGLNEVINTITKPQTQITTILALNDDIADGRDVSWIWDADYEKLIPRLRRAIVTGTRAEDLALRLKYAGFQPHQIVIKKKPARALEFSIEITKSGETIILIPTYTAMLTIRKIFSRLGATHSTWKD